MELGRRAPLVASARQHRAYKDVAKGLLVLDPQAFEALWLCVLLRRFESWDWSVWCVWQAGLGWMSREHAGTIRRGRWDMSDMSSRIACRTVQAAEDSGLEIGRHLRLTPGLCNKTATSSAAERGLS